MDNATIWAGGYKKRLDKYRARSIILAKGGTLWIYAYHFAKKGKDNIDSDDLINFRKLAKQYERLEEKQIGQLIRNRDWTEICDG